MINGAAQNLVLLYFFEESIEIVAQHVIFILRIVHSSKDRDFRRGQPKNETAMANVYS